MVSFKRWKLKDLKCSPKGCIWIPTNVFVSNLDKLWSLSMYRHICWTTVVGCLLWRFISQLQQETIGCNQQQKSPAVPKFLKETRKTPAIKLLKNGTCSYLKLSVICSIVSNCQRFTSVKMLTNILSQNNCSLFHNLIDDPLFCLSEDCTKTWGIAQ